MSENPLGIAPRWDLRGKVPAAGRRKTLDLHHWSSVRPLGSSEIGFGPRHAAATVGEQARRGGFGEAQPGPAAIIQPRNVSREIVQPCTSAAFSAASATYPATADDPG